MTEKYADRTATLEIHTRGGCTIPVPGIPVGKAEEYSAMLFGLNASGHGQTPLSMYGQDGLVRAKVYPAEVAGTTVAVAGEGKNPWAGEALPDLAGLEG